MPNPHFKQLSPAYRAWGSTTPTGPMVYNRPPNKMKKTVFLTLALTLAVTAWAYDFSAVAPTGQTLYYYINADSTTVSIGRPYNWGWGDYAMPTDSLTISNAVTYSGTTYSVTSIMQNAFSNCTGLITVSIPNTLTTIEWEAFNGCTGLTAVSIPSSVTSIGDNTFSGCTSLTTISLPNSVTTIGNNAFSGCSSLTSVSLPNSVTTVGEAAFYGCTRLTSITLSNSMTTIEDRVFYNCANLTSVSIPNSITSIGYSAFHNCSSLTSVSIPTSVTTIGNSAFSSCTGLASVSIPNSVTTIGESAFNGCTGLTTVSLPNSIRTIQYQTFFNCTKLASIAIPNYVNSIGQNAFRNCTDLASVSIPNSVTSIERSAFSDCLSLSPVSIPNSVTSIGNDAFSHVKMIYYNGYASGQPWGALCLNGYIEDSLYYTDNTKALLTGAHPSIATAIIPNTVLSIGDYAFEGCTKLLPVSIPNAITSIENSAFHYVKMIYYHGNATGSPWGALCMNGYIEDSLYYTDHSKTTLTGAHPSIVFATIPNSVSTPIEKAAFYRCTSLISVSIGKSVNGIHIDAFRGCTRLSHIAVQNMYPASFSTNSFMGIPRNCILTVPCGRESIYRISQWGTYFPNIEEALFNQVWVKTADSTMGTASVSAQPTCDTPATIVATANEGYRFSHWSDENTDNPRYLVVTQDTIITAFFESTNNIGNPQPQVGNAYTTKDRRIVVEGAAGQRIRVFDVMGRMVATLSEATETAHFHMVAAGVYLVQVGDGASQRVVIR